MSLLKSLTLACIAALTLATGTSLAAKASETVPTQEPTPPTTLAVPISNQIWQYTQTRRCLDSTGAGPRNTYNYGVPCSYSSNERWTLTTWSDGTYRVRNQATSLCLFVDWEGNAYEVRTRSCIGGAAEGWKFDSFSGGVFRVRNVSTNTCIQEEEQLAYHRYALRMRPCATQTYTPLT